MKHFIFITSFLFIFTSVLNAQNAPNINEPEIYNQARQNIEKYRKTDFSVQLSSLNKKDLKDIEIEVEQTSHDFLFGCIIFDLVSKGEIPYNENEFKEKFKNLFNFAILPFYWAGYEPIQGKTNQQKIMKVAKWCSENGITTKGHPALCESSC